MIRALTTLVGLACAAALLLLVNDTGSADGGGLWKRAALLGGAGLVAGAFYQLGGIRRPGVRLNIPLLHRGVPTLDAARARDLRQPLRDAGLARRPHARRPPGQRADALVAVVPDPRLRGRPAVRVRAARAVGAAGATDLVRGRSRSGVRDRVRSRTRVPSRSSVSPTRSSRRARWRAVRLARVYGEQLLGDRRRRAGACCAPYGAAPGTRPRRRGRHGPSAGRPRARS